MDGDSREDGRPTAEPPNTFENQIDDPDIEEFIALGRIAHAFREYRTDAEWEIRRWEYNFGKYVNNI